MNTIDKLASEYRSELAKDQTIWLKIRFTPGMEMLAHELSTGRRIYEQDVTNLGGRRAGEQVNLEFDMLAKYIDRQLALREDAARNPQSAAAPVRPVWQS